MAPSVDPSQWTYTDYVCFLRSHGFQNLGMLDEYLEWGLNAKHSPQVRQPETSRTMLLEINRNQTRLSDLSDLKKLRMLLSEWTRPKSAGSASSNSPTGRIIMVENISPSLVDTLGGILNIEPTFFASHLEDTSMNASPDASTTPLLASKSIRDQHEFFTNEYISAFIPIGCPKDVEGLSLQSKGNYCRKIELVQKQGRQKVALARRKISFFMKKTDPWLCIVLVDPPLGTFSSGFTNFNAVTPSQIFDVLPYSGGYLDFIEMRKPLDRQHHDFRDCRHRLTSPSAFDDLLRHWQIQARDGLFSTSHPSLSTFMRPTFQIAASECSSFFTYLRSTLESQTPTLALTPTTQHTLRRNLDRCIFVDTLLSRFKPTLTRAKDFVSSSPDLKEDYRALLHDLHHYRAECDSQMQQISSVLQSFETSSMSSLSSEAMRRADYLRYLTIIALIYAPFAIACAIFTMPRDFAPAAHYLYGFLPVTAVVTIIFVLLVLPESRDPWPSLRDTICGGLTRKKLLAKQRPESSGRGSQWSGEREKREKWGWEDV